MNRSNTLYPAFKVIYNKLNYVIILCKSMNYDGRILLNNDQFISNPENKFDDLVAEYSINSKNSESKLFVNKDNMILEHSKNIKICKNCFLQIMHHNNNLYNTLITNTKANCINNINIIDTIIHPKVKNPKFMDFIYKYLEQNHKDEIKKYSLIAKVFKVTDIDIEEVQYIINYINDKNFQSHISLNLFNALYKDPTLKIIKKSKLSKIHDVVDFVDKFQQINLSK